MTRIHRKLIVALLAALALPAGAAGTLDKVKESGKLVLGYRADTRPFAFSDGGKPAGFSVALCQKVAEAVKAELKQPALAIEFVAVSAAERFDALRQGRIDLSCGTDTPTLQRRSDVEFSIPIFLSGVGAVVRSDSPQRLRDVLAGRGAPVQPVWRGAPGDYAQTVVFAALGGTTVEKSLIDALKARRIQVTVKPVADYAAGLQAVLDRQAAALFGDRPVLLEAAQRGAAAGQLLVIERSFSREPVALAMRRDDGMRLLVDRTLSRLYRSNEFAALYGQWFGTPATDTLEFFRAIALPD